MKKELERACVFCGNQPVVAIAVEDEAEIKLMFRCRACSAKWCRIRFKDLKPEPMKPLDNLFYLDRKQNRALGVDGGGDER